MAGLVISNLWAKKARSIGLGFAVAVAVMTVVTLNVVGEGLENAAAAVLTIGKADFTVAQKGVANILSSTLDDQQLQQVRDTAGVASAVGVLVETEKINAANPLFLEIGIPPSELTRFGVSVVAGHPYAADATNQMMMGWRAAQNFGVHVGSRFRADGTLPGVSVAAVQRRIDATYPELTTIRTATQFGRADRNLVFLQAAATGSTILAIVIGAVIVGNAMLLSLLERTREFGLLRAVGWSRMRVVSLLLGEGLVLGLVGAAVGVGLSYLAVAVLERLPDLRGVLQVSFTGGAFARALYTGLGMTVVGTLYPALRAAYLRPLAALSHE